jgi:hypothetical protein
MSKETKRASNRLTRPLSTDISCCSYWHLLIPQKIIRSGFGVRWPSERRRRFDRYLESPAFL